MADRETIIVLAKTNFARQRVLPRYAAASMVASVARAGSWTKAPRTRQIEA